MAPTDIDDPDSPMTHPGEYSATSTSAANGLRPARASSARCRGSAWLVLCLGGSLASASCVPADLGFLDPQGPVAEAQRQHLAQVVLLVLIAALPVLVLAPLFAWRYRYSNQRARYRPQWDFSGRLEVVVWGVPVAITAVLMALLWSSTHALDPYRPVAAERPTLHVRVIGLDWKWLFIYPDLRIASVGEFAFPADHQVALDLTSATVMQSFLVPALAGQIYAMGGMVTRLNLAADGPGTFLGQNTQYNGSGFYRQKFAARALEPAAFEAWVANVAATGTPLDAAAYATLALPSTAAKARDALALNADAPAGTIYFNNVPPRLFETAVARTRGARAPGRDAGEEAGARREISLAAEGICSARSSRERPRDDP
jgi:cytochrome o ubiquinol oxidase subunit 2